MRMPQLAEVSSPRESPVGVVFPLGSCVTPVAGMQHNRAST